MHMAGHQGHPACTVGKTQGVYHENLNWHWIDLAVSPERGREHGARSTTTLNRPLTTGKGEVNFDTIWYLMDIIRASDPDKRVWVVPNVVSVINSPDIF